MIAWNPVWAIVLRHLRLWSHDINYLLGTLYWPLLDIIIWGFLGKWIQQSHGFENYESIALLGILLWQIIGRGCNIFILSFVEELWSNNVVNLFSLPIRISEWICGVMVFFALMLLITFAFCMAFVLLLYDVAIWPFLSTFLIFLPPLIFSAIWIGFTCLQIITILGKRGSEMSFVVAWFLLPFSGAYYPIEVLPHWGQVVSTWLPMSYVFQGMRAYIMHQQDPTPYLLKGYALSIVYALCAVILFVYCFNRCRSKGLARLVN